MARRRSRGSSVWFSLNRVPVGRRGIESPGQFERLRPSHVPQSCSALRYQTRRAAMDSRSEHQLMLLHVVDAAGEIGEFPVAGGFFFQAEDGIRDLYVTGVQTCALPI